MSFLASAVATEAAALCNDKNQTLYTTTRQLPYLNLALRELTIRLSLNGVKVTKQEVAAPLLVNAGDKTYDALPADFLYPIELHEQAIGGDEDDWVEIKERDFLPDWKPTETLRVWAYNGEEVQFVSATVDVNVRLRYWKSLTVIASGSTLIAVKDAQTYMSFKTAALIAAFIGENYKRAQALDTQAELHFGFLANQSIHGRQDQPAKKRPFRLHRTFWR